MLVGHPLAWLAAAFAPVGGGILMHGLPGMHEVTHHLLEPAQRVPFVGGLTTALIPTLINAVVGVFAGAFLVCVATMGKSFLAKKRANP